MKKLVFILCIIIVLAVVSVIVFRFMRHRSADSSGKGTAGAPATAVQLPAARPEPDVSLNVNNEADLNVYQGTPLLLTVRLANKRAANVQAANEARQAIAADAREQFKAGKITAAELQAREASSRQSEEVPTLVLPADWPKRIHLQIHRADDRAVQPDWAFSILAAPEKQALVLDATAATEATWTLSPEAAANITPGTWQVIAMLDTAGATGNDWRGQATSQPVSIAVKPRPASVSVAEAEQEALGAARYYAASAQWDRSLAEARKAAKLNENSIEAHTLVGDALSAGGDKDGAMKAYQTAMAEFNKQNKDPRYVPDYLIERMHKLLLATPPLGIAPEGTNAPPPPNK